MQRTWRIEGWCEDVAVEDLSRGRQGHIEIGQLALETQSRVLAQLRRASPRLLDQRRSCRVVLTMVGSE